MLEPESVQGAVLAAAGEVQALMNHLGLSARSAPTAKLVFEPDLRSSVRRALQFGRSEPVSIEAPLGKSGVLALATDVVVAGKTRTPQLAMEMRWHPRGEDHAGFAGRVMWDVAKMALARSKDAVEQATVLVAAPPRFWRWLGGQADDRGGYELLGPQADTPVSTKSDVLAGDRWDVLFDEGMDEQLPERLWTSFLGDARIRSPWLELELHLLDVKGLGGVRAVRDRAG